MTRASACQMSASEFEGEASNLQLLVRASAARLPLRVLMTCERGPGLEVKIGRLVRQFQGELRTIMLIPSGHEQLWRSEISFVPRSTFSAAEILIALARCGEVNLIAD